MKRMDRRGILLALPVLLVVGGCGTGEADEAGPTIQTVAAERGDLRITAEATGTVEPIRRVEVKSKASGEILRLHVDIGDEVEPGALLAEVDPRDVRNRFDQTQADLEVAQASADIAEAQLERSRQLHESGVITDQELETARLEYSNAQANLTRARTNHELAEIQLGDVRIRAPMAGTILEKNVEEGVVIQSASQNVSGGTTLFVMASLDQMQARTLVDETDMGEIRAGMAAQVTVEAFPDRVFRGVVEKVEPQATVDQNVTMFPVIVNLDNRRGFLKPGMNAEVEILIDQATGVLLVPNNAVVSPQDAVPAAMALGLDPDELDTSAFGGGRFARAMGGPGGEGGPPARAGGGQRPGAADPGGARGEAGTRGVPPRARTERRPDRSRPSVTRSAPGSRAATSTRTPPGPSSAPGWPGRWAPPTPAARRSSSPASSAGSVRRAGPWSSSSIRPGPPRRSSWRSA